MVIIMGFLMIGMISIMLPRADVAAQRGKERARVAISPRGEQFRLCERYPVLRLHQRGYHARIQ